MIEGDQYVLRRSALFFSFTRNGFHFSFPSNIILAGVQAAVHRDVSLTGCKALNTHHFTQCFFFYDLTGLYLYNFEGTLGSIWKNFSHDCLVYFSLPVSAPQIRI